MKQKLLIFFFIFSVSGFAQNPLPFGPTSNSSGFGFGGRLAFDGNRLLASTSNSEGATNSNNLVGKVYLFTISGTSAIQTDTFYPSDAMPTDGFGSSISMQNDFFAVGASYKNGNGAVYIYHNNNGWLNSQTLIAPDGELNDRFGSSVKLYNSHLFITASGAKAIYIYKYNGTNWIYSQKLNPGNMNLFGYQIECENDRMVTVGSVGTNATKFYTYALTTNGNWELFTTSATMGDFNTMIGNFALANDLMYLTISGLGQTPMIKVLNYSSGNWENPENLILNNQTDQYFTRIKVSNDKMFIGSTDYGLSMERNFPLLYYKKIGNNWIYQQTYYGTGQQNNDDLFGSSIEISGNILIVGAPSEGIINQGKAYIIDVSLSIDDLDKNNIALYPNPSKSDIFIKTNGFFPVLKAEVFSINGSLMITQNSPEKINTNNLKAGIYFVKLYFDQGSQKTLKFIKN